MPWRPGGPLGPGEPEGPGGPVLDSPGGPAKWIEKVSEASLKVEYLEFSTTIYFHHPQISKNRGSNTVI